MYDEQCLRCNRICRVQNQKYNTEVDLDNCPLEEAKNAGKVLRDFMPLLCQFNDLLEQYNMEPVRWNIG